MLSTNKWVRYNLGSGQRPFKHLGWIDIDCQERFEPSIVSRVETFQAPEPADAIVLSHVLEHFNLEGGEELLRNCWRNLKSGGLLYVSVPDAKVLARAWLDDRIDDYIYRVNMHGAWMGDIADLHKWSFSAASLAKTIKQCGDWSAIKLGRSDERLADTDLSSDWWYVEMEAIKA